MLRYIVTLAIGTLIGILGQQYVQPKTVAVFDSETKYEQAAQWIARALYSESKLLSNYEYIAWTIRNRMASNEYPGTAKQVVLQEDQFSAFNDPEKVDELTNMTYPHTKDTYFRRAYRIALYVLNSDKSVNPMPEVTHFYMEDTMERVHSVEKPNWARGREPYFSNGQTNYFKNIQAP